MDNSERETSDSDSVSSWEPSSDEDWRHNTPQSTMRNTKATRKAKRLPCPYAPSRNTRYASTSTSASTSGTASYSKGKGAHVTTTSSSSSSSSPSSSPPRRPIRPVDRQKMLDWLLEKLNHNEMPKSLRWEEVGKVFLVKWPHAARHGFCKDDDAQLYKAYAQHTGLYREGDSGDHKRWKANFRCALHSLPNVKEISTKDGRKGPNAARRFKILDKAEVRAKKTSKRQSRPERSPEPKEDDSDSGVSVIVEGQDSLPLTVIALPPIAADDNEAADTGSNVPNFHHLGLTTFIDPNHLSGGCVKEMPLISSPSPIAALASDFFTTLPTPSISSTLVPSSSSSSSTSSSSSSSSTSSSSSFASSSFSSSSLFTVSLDSPAPTTPATTTTATTATAATTIIHSQLLPPELGEDMVPVGIMTVCSRDRSPSGDSGLPGSPPVGGRVVLLEERGGGGGGGVGGEQFLALNIEDAMPEVDEGILTDIGANVSIDECEMETIDLEQSGVSVNFLREFLDISHNRPDCAVSVQITTQDDFMHTSPSM